MSKFEIHISDVNTFKQCRRLWDWTSPLRQNLEPDRPYAPFFLGSIVHDTLELYYGQGMDYIEALSHAITRQVTLLHQQTDIWPAEEDMMEEQIELATGILHHYRLWITGKLHAGQPWADENFEFESIEQEFSVPFYTKRGNPSNRVYYAGRFDGIARHKETGKLWVWENKTARSIKRLVDTLWNAPQATAYVLAAKRIFGHDQVEGIIYNILRKKVPTNAPVLKSGLLSTAKHVSTTFEWYVNQVQKHHGPAKPHAMSKKDLILTYQEHLRYLAADDNNYFERLMIRRNDHQLELFEHELHQAALEMSRESTPAFAEPGLHCGWCRFQEPCHAKDAGLNVSLLLDAEYRERKDRVPPDEEILSDD